MHAFRVTSPSGSICTVPADSHSSAVDAAGLGTSSDPVTVTDLSTGVERTIAPLDTL